MTKEIRITSGIVKNKKLKAPDIEGFRAVQEIAKLALFSILGEKVEGAICLDLFAGSGNLGLEALSRGAAWCDFVDEHYNSIKVIRENVKNCARDFPDFEEKSEIIRDNAVKFTSEVKKTYDIIFLDPFYSDTSHVFLMKNLQEILGGNGIIAFFHGENLDIEKVIKDTSLVVTTERKFGKSLVTVISKG